MGETITLTFTCAKVKSLSTSQVPAIIGRLETISDICDVYYNLLFRVRPIQLLRDPIHGDASHRMYVELCFLMTTDVITI